MDLINDRMMWYRDSFVIAENLAISFGQINNVEVERRAYVKSYTFMDLKNKSFYVYSSYTDTGRLLNTYIQTDTGKIEGGWNFFKNKGIFTFPNHKLIGDTIIDGIRYGRVRAEGLITGEGKVSKQIETAYLRCDKKGSFFYFDKPESEKNGCPVLRLDTELNGYYYKVSEMVFHSNKLTNEQEQIFDLWEKNAREHPASRNKQ